MAIKDNRTNGFQPVQGKLIFAGYKVNEQNVKEMFQFMGVRPTKEIVEDAIKDAKENNRTYNESNLLTFEDKLNWLTIHDSTSLKGKCADKIMLHKYSKYILGKDYCNKIIKIYNYITLDYGNSITFATIYSYRHLSCGF